MAASESMILNLKRFLYAHIFFSFICRENPNMLNRFAKTEEELLREQAKFLINPKALKQVSNVSITKGKFSTLTLTDFRSIKERS